MSDHAHAIDNAKAWFETITELVARINGQDQDAADAAREEAMESPLSVMVRDGWRTPGGDLADGPEEYEILLTTGGPALRVCGTISRGEPDSAVLEWQDWGTPWTSVDMSEAEHRILLAFAGCFYYGEL